MSNTSWTSPHSGPAAAAGGDDSWLKPDEPAAGELTTSSSNHFSAQDGDPNDDAPVAEKGTTSRRKCGKSTILFAFSSLFLALFIYSAVVQNNDDDSLLWLFFYALQATIPCTFLAHYFVCFPSKIVYSLCASMTIYSIALLVIGAIDLSKSEAGGAKVGTGDEDKRTLQEELIFELAGAGLGLISALYHMMVTKCCVAKREVPEYKGGEEDAAEGPIV